jgi:hypothetical protein
MKMLPPLRHWLLLLLLCLPRTAAAKEFLTDEEISKIQDAQEIDRRVKVYLDAAELRLKTADDRLNGQESKPGDALEFFSVEEMIDGYCQILDSVMSNLDGAYRNSKTERRQLEKALKNLRGATEKAQKELELLQKLAEEKQKEDLWKLTGKALEITEAAHEGAEQAIK